VVLDETTTECEDITALLVVQIVSLETAHSAAMCGNGAALAAPCRLQCNRTLSSNHCKLLKNLYSYQANMVDIVNHVYKSNRIESKQ